MNRLTILIARHLGIEGRENGRCLRPALPMNRAAMRLGLSVGIAIALTGCGKQPLSWADLPKDPQVFTFVLSQCLSVAKGPQRTVYNDWDDAIDSCKWAAESASRYCPEGVECTKSTVTRADVRAILPASGTSASGQDPQGLEAKPAGPAPKEDAQ